MESTSNTIFVPFTMMFKNTEQRNLSNGQFKMMHEIFRACAMRINVVQENSAESLVRIDSATNSSMKFESLTHFKTFYNIIFSRFSFISNNSRFQNYLRGK